MNPFPSLTLPARFSLAAAVLLLLGFAVTCLTHWAEIEKYPLIFPWVFLAVGTAFPLYYLNFAGLPLRRALPWFAFGVLATVGGFALQSIINGSLVRALGNEWVITWTGAMVLGFGSAFCQTLGKMAAIFLAFQWKHLRESPLFALAAGLGIGMGFGITEVVFLGLQMVATNSPIESLLGVLERAIAVWFHLFTGGLLAAAFLWRLWWPAVLVILTHTLMDGLSVALAHRIPILQLEALFLLLAAIVYGGWLFLVSRHRSLHGGGDQPASF